MNTPFERLRGLYERDWSVHHYDGSHLLIWDGMCRWWLAWSDVPAFLAAWDAEKDPAEKYTTACQAVPGYHDDDVPPDLVQAAIADGYQPPVAGF